MWPEPSKPWLPSDRVYDAPRTTRHVNFSGRFSRSSLGAAGMLRIRLLRSTWGRVAPAAAADEHPRAYRDNQQRHEAKRQHFVDTYISVAERQGSGRRGLRPNEDKGALSGQQANRAEKQSGFQPAGEGGHGPGF